MVPCSKCACSLGAVLIAWMLGMSPLSPTLVQYTNWVGEFQCQATVLRTSNISELQAAVRAAPSVRATGSGCSFNTMACPKSYGLIVDMRGFQEMELLDGGKLVRVQGGVYFGQLLDFLLESGLSVSRHPGNPTYTVAGCLATGCHNMGMLHVDDATKLTFVTANGSLRSVTPDDPDWPAAAVSMGRLGIIFEATLKTSFYEPHTTSTRSIPMTKSDTMIDVLQRHRDTQASNASQRMRLEFRIELGDLQEQMYEWSPKRGEKLDIPLAEGFTHFKNPSYFRLQPNMFSGGAIMMGLDIFQQGFASAADKLSLHTWSQEALSGMPEKMKRRHQGRAGNSEVLWGNRHTWANVVDETVNFLLSLRHSEVVFPLEPRERAMKCMDVFFKYKHFYWFRSYIRMMPGDSYHLSTVHVPGADPKSTWFVRVDFVTPAKVLGRDEQSFTRDLHEHCPGWRKHWGKSLWATSAEEPWGNAAAFSEVVARWDPACKFRPVDWPSWVDTCPGLTGGSAHALAAEA